MKSVAEQALTLAVTTQISDDKDKDVSIATIDVTDKYDAEPTVSFENGLLKLKFTIKPEEKPKKLSIK
jgi:hypothetical protein